MIPHPVSTSYILISSYTYRILYFIVLYWNEWQNDILMLNTTCNIDALNLNEIYIPRYLQKIRFHFNKKHVPIKKYIHSSIVKITEAVNNRDKTWKGIHRGKRSKRECTLYFCTMSLTFILIYRTFLCEMKYHQKIF